MFFFFVSFAGIVTASSGNRFQLLIEINFYILSLLIVLFMINLDSITKFIKM
jgi:hypothetical protein